MENSFVELIVFQIYFLVRIIGFKIVSQRPASCWGKEDRLENHFGPIHNLTEWF